MEILVEFMVLVEIAFVCVARWVMHFLIAEMVEPSVVGIVRDVIGENLERSAEIHT